MRIRIKKLNPEAVVPRYAHFGDAAVDLVAARKWEDDHGNLCYGTGLAMEIPESHVGLLFPRSSISKTNLRLCNSVGVIDSGYRGEIIFKFGWVESSSVDAQVYDKGDRIGQIMIMPYPKIEFVESNELSVSERGTGGFGSTGQ